MRTLVIVTGGSAGLGRALLATAPAGARRIDVSRSGPGSDDALADVHHLAADLADPASWERVGHELRREIGSAAWERVSVLHSAGTLDPIGFAGEVDADAYTGNVLLNSAAGQVLGHHLLAAMRELDARRELVMLSSGAARTAYPGWSSYGAAKAAMDQWVRTVGAEQAIRGGVRVLAVARAWSAPPCRRPSARPTSATSHRWTASDACTRTTSSRTPTRSPDGSGRSSTTTRHRPAPWSTCATTVEPGCATAVA
jgi:benzil reductase ((S)-benzoin forming)